MPYNPNYDGLHEFIMQSRNLGKPQSSILPKLES